MVKTPITPNYVGAYLIEGDALSLDMLIARLEKEGFIARGDADLYLRAYHSFGIDDARELRDRAQRRALARDGRVFAVFAPGMTTDAQNALLKVFEEPPAGAVFFLIVPSPQTLLPTLRSRMQTLSLASTRSLADAEAFLAASSAQRLEMLKGIYEHDESDGRDMGKVLVFLQSLEERFAKERPSREKTEGLAAIYRARRYVGDKGSLLKALLEQMALLTPRI
jgi:DNA polymerase III delta prime subunit